MPIEVPASITNEMWEVLDSISDEVGEQPIEDRYLLKYEGWSPSCFPSSIRTEGAMRNYASERTPSVLREWDSNMRKRGYVPTQERAYDDHLGLYGVTYALYRRRNGTRHDRVLYDVGASPGAASPTRL